MSSSTPVKILYFAWLRERVGLEEEMVALPAELGSVGDLLDWLAQRGEGYAYALENKEVVRVALNQKVARHDAPIGDAREIALFPPMTGG